MVGSVVERRQRRTRVDAAGGDASTGTSERLLVRCGEQPAAGRRTPRRRRCRRRARRRWCCCRSVAALRSSAVPWPSPPSTSRETSGWTITRVEPGRSPRRRSWSRSPPRRAGQGAPQRHAAAARPAPGSRPAHRCRRTATDPRRCGRPRNAVTAELPRLQVDDRAAPASAGWLPRSKVAVPPSRQRGVAGAAVLRLAGPRSTRGVTAVAPPASVASSAWSVGGADLVGHGRRSGDPTRAPGGRRARASSAARGSWTRRRSCG